MKSCAQKVTDYSKLLDELPLLNVLLAEEKKALADALVEMVFTQGQEIITQGQTGDTFYILYDGQVEVVKDGKTVKKLESCTKQSNTAQFFGEQALLKNEPRTA